jgi:hypothetical protein
MRHLKADSKLISRTLPRNIARHKAALHQKATSRRFPVNHLTGTVDPW